MYYAEIVGVLAFVVAGNCAKLLNNIVVYQGKIEIVCSVILG